MKRIKFSVVVTVTTGVVVVVAPIVVVVVVPTPVTVVCVGSGTVEELDRSLSTEAVHPPTSVAAMMNNP
jgi:hypothetical protein